MKRTSVPPDVARFLDAWFAVRQFIQAANFNRFQGAGLSATQFMSLNLLPPGGAGIPIGELARRMNLKPATVARTIDSLEARNLVTRLRNPPDKRIVLVAATPAGIELQNAASKHFQAQIATLFRAMPRAERDGLIRGLESFSRAATNANGPGASARPVHPSPSAPDRRTPHLSRGARAAPPPSRSNR